MVNKEMRLNAWGQIAYKEWFKTAVLRPYVKLDPAEFVVMPDHLHGIIWIENDDGRDIPAIIGSRRRRTPTNDHLEQFGKPVSHSIPTIVRAYKSAVTYAVNALHSMGRGGVVLWQRNYYEHVIRDEKDLRAKRGYILSNPLNWEMRMRTSSGRHSVAVPYWISCPPGSTGLTESNGIPKSRTFFKIPCKAA
jgi:REP element-mobilizing transposase RayT